jgi:hypothetical protein
MEQALVQLMLHLQLQDPHQQKQQQRIWMMMGQVAPSGFQAELSLQFEWCSGRQLARPVQQQQPAAATAMGPAVAQHGVCKLACTGW